MDGLDVPSILSGWPTVVSGGTIGLLLFLALRLTFGARKIAADADERTARARADAEAAQRELDEERERRRRIEDSLTTQILALRRELAELRQKVDQLTSQAGG